MEKERKRFLLNKGDKNKHSHLVIIVDKSEFIPEEITRYVERTENIKDVLFKYVCNPNLDILYIYNYDMDLETQLSETRPYHITIPYDMTNEAYIYAREKHEGGFRKDGKKYITHPIKVAELVRQYFSKQAHSNELIVAAYLHDVVEDTDATIEDIKRKFGEYVAYLVNSVTNDDEEKNAMGKTNYLCNKILNMNEEPLNLKLCDRLANVLDLENAPIEFAEKYETETTIILDYLLANRKLTNTQMEIVKAINNQINKLRRKKILLLINRKACSQQ